MTSGHSIYNNTCYNNSTGSFDLGELNFYSGASSDTVENNIFVASTGKHVLVAYPGSTTGHTLILQPILQQFGDAIRLGRDILQARELPERQQPRCELAELGPHILQGISGPVLANGRLSRHRRGVEPWEPI